MGNEITADRIRDHLRNSYLNPARSRGESIVRIVAGEVHKELHLRNRLPAVCQVLGGKKFLVENDLILERQEGPRSGQSTTATFIYRLAGYGAALHDQGDARWRSLRGIGKEVFRALGGGEAFLKNERKSFYDSGRDPLHRDEE